MEQQDFVADKDGNIEWKGGLCPVAGGTKVRVSMRAGYVATFLAEDADWRHHGIACDITSYRIVEDAQEQEGSAMVVGELMALPVRDYRKELWIGVAVAVVGAKVSVGAGESAESWANSALEAFDKAFPVQDGA